jgi:hypothetical protein
MRKPQIYDHSQRLLFMPDYKTPEKQQNMTQFKSESFFKDAMKKEKIQSRNNKMFSDLQHNHKDAFCSLISNNIRCLLFGLLPT